MYALYKYAKKKRNERQARLAQPPSGNAVGEQSGRAELAGTEANATAHAHADATASQPGTPAPGVATKASPKHESSPEEVAEKKRRRRYRWKIVLGLAGPFALQALDSTIIASALPYIASDFHEIKQLNWIISSFNLTSASFLFLWAQLADIFGRHGTLQAAVIIMIVGSAICTGAPTSLYSVLLLGRGLQGVGAAGINISVRTILADRVSLRDYVLNWTIFIVVASVSFSIGPVIGGYLTEASWRWCFAINLPIGVLAILVVLLLLRKELLGPQPLPELRGRDTSTRRGRLLARLSTIDYGGQLLFLWGFGLLSLALTWGGGTYAWTAAAVLAPLVIGAVLVIGWAWINFAGGMAMFAIMYFMDLYFAIVQGKSSGNAGIGLLYFLPGMGVGAYMAMFSANTWPRQTLPALLLGSVTAAVGVTVLSWAIHAERTSVIYGMMALVGQGVGIRMNPGSMHGLAYFPAKTATVQCLMSFAMPFGGLVGLTIMSTVFTNTSGIDHANAKAGIMYAFVAIIPFMWICVLLTTFLGNVWILKEGGGHEVVHGAYLWSLITRNTLPRERMTRGDDSTKLAPVMEENHLEKDVEAAAPQPLRD